MHSKCLSKCCTELPVPEFSLPMAFDWQAELVAPLGRSAVNHALSAATVLHPPKPVQKISFAQALSASTIPTASNDNLPQPLIRGDTVSIHITQDIYEKGMDFCKRNLRGRLVLNKGDKPYTTKDIYSKLHNHKPYTTKDIYSKLHNQWKTKGAWSMTTLGRGYYEFFFSSEEDMRMTWAMGTINLKPGVLRLFEWQKDFNMHKQRNTHAQVWIRLLELPQEYWMDRTLREIASALGTPLLIDSATSKRIYGHYARILVDMDFSKQIFHEITVEREGYAFQVEVAYEWLPDYCTHCHTIGHDISSCRWLYPKKDNIVHKENIVQGKKSAPLPNKTWAPIKDNPSGIGSSIAFAAPQTNKEPIITEAEAHTITVQQQDTAHKAVNHEIIVVEEISPSATVKVPSEHQNLGSAPETTQQKTPQQEANDAPIVVPAHVPFQQVITLTAEDVEHETLEVDNSDAQHVADTTISTHDTENLEQTSDILIHSSTVNNVQQTDKASASKLVQQNRFEVLFNEEDMSKEVLRSNSRAQVTEETETDSEFVDNSLDVVHKTIISPVQSESENDGRDLAALERKNNEFLDQSWANIAEDEEGVKHLDALDGNTSVQPDDDFQVVKSKKASIRKEPSLVSCYKTRANDAVTDLDCHQDDVLNPNIAHDLKILRPHLKGNVACASVPRVYTDEEEREAAINYLKNRSVAEEEPFIEVSNTKKKNVQKRYQVHITSARGRRYI